jgi:protocatechuate 3,4-dioxygenase alpha subunit
MTEQRETMLGHTPSQTVGPFYEIGLIHEGENSLVDARTQGEQIVITGTIYDGDGVPIPDAMIEIWQADAQGHFNHPADPNCHMADKHFRGFGRAGTPNGEFVFRTIKPGGITGNDGRMQAPHVNVRVFARGMLLHADTRLYFSDESANANDELLNSVDPDRRHTLIAERAASGQLPTYRFDIHMQGENETIFFAL